MLVPGAGGGRTNGLKGGRPPDEFRAKMRELASLPEVEDYFAACIKGEHGPMIAMRAKEYADERGYGKEAQVTKVVGDAVEPLIIKVVRG